MKKKTLAVFAIGLLALSLTVFAACETTARRNPKDSTDSGSTSEHEHDYDTIVVPPTCEEKGFTTYVCKICGFAYAGDYVDATGHDWGDGDMITAPTFEAAGEMTYTCTVCGKTKTEPIAQLVHNYAFDSFEWDGFTARAKYVCTNDASHVAYFNANVTERVTEEPTCTETGIKISTASFSGYIDSKTEVIAALGHNKVTHAAKDPTCTEIGWNAYETCTRCDYTTYETIPALGHNYDGDICMRCGAGICYTRIDEDGSINATGGYILFGEYPQTVKADSVTITSTTDSRGYYLGSDGAYYAKVTANPYDSLLDEDYTFTTGETVVSGNTYYFKVEPIKWKILEITDGTAIILCEMIIDAHAYQNNFTNDSGNIFGPFYTTANGASSGTYANNYEYSEIRRWLNDNFYKTAFTELEKGIINTVQVDNSVKSTLPYGLTGYSGVNDYACADTYDKVWLMSEEEITKSWKYVNYASYEMNDTQRRKQTTDYAKANYAYTYNWSVFGDSYGNGSWWLRSPHNLTDLTISKNVISIDGDGRAGSGGGGDRFSTGVAPALQITLGESASHSHSYSVAMTKLPCTEDGYTIFICTGCGDEYVDDYIPATGHDYVSGVCTRCRAIDHDYYLNKAYIRIDENGNASETGEYILFGEYPQTVKADSVTITSTTDSRGYYLGSDGAYYAKVTANPFGSSYIFTTGAIIQNGTVYYFKVEPIKWRILEDYDGTATILCEMIIDAHRFNDNSNNYRFDDDSNNYSNNYKESEICAWLNNNFYQTAFSELEKRIINTVQVNNDYDKVWLMSKEEITKSWKYVNYASISSSDTQRCKQTTDYAKANYAYTYTYPGSGYGNGFWLLRSGSFDYESGSGRVYFVNYSGDALSYGGVDNSYYGVVPALQITLDSEQSGGKKYVRVDEDGNESATGGYILFGEYPQTVKADSVTITSTTDSRGYYLGSDGAYYAKVTAFKHDESASFTTGATIVSGTVYYFKVEPIKWRILEDDDGTATILCEMIIDAHAYQNNYTYNSSNSRYYTTANGAPNGTYANNYEYSEIRKWLNDNFYQTAFSELERGIINTVQVDNSNNSVMAHNKDGDNGYWSNCTDTYDKLWLMSREEITRSWKYVDYTSYGYYYAQKLMTDYVTATYDETYYGNGVWWLRSPHNYYYDKAWDVFIYGYEWGDFSSCHSSLGVVPALQITL